MPNPFPYYRADDLLCFRLDGKGMSNTLWGAMECGCRVVAVRSAVGSAEILDNGRYGPLVSAEPRRGPRAVLASLADGAPAEKLWLVPGIRSRQVDESLC